MDQWFNWFPCTNNWNNWINGFIDLHFTGVKENGEGLNGIIDLQIKPDELIHLLSRLNLLRALSSQTEEELDKHKKSDEQKESDGHDVSQDVLMDFEQELLDMDDIMPEDSTPPLIVPPAEICVNSEHQVDRVSDVVVLKLKLEFWRQAQANKDLLSRVETYYSNRNHLTAREQKHQQQVRILKYVTIAKRSPCKDRVKCKGRGGDKHPYDRCADKLSACTKCDLISHKSYDHETLDPVLRPYMMLTPTSLLISSWLRRGLNPPRTGSTGGQLKEGIAGMIPTGKRSIAARAGAGTESQEISTPGQT